MGVGIGAAKEISGGLAAAGVASRMIETEKHQALEQGGAAYEANIKDTAEAKDLKETQIPDAQGQADLANDNYEAMKIATAAIMNDPKSTPDQKLQATIDEQGALDDRTAAQRALSELEGKLTAIQERRIRQAKAMERGRRWGGAY